MKNKGFTLIELVIVMAIIATLTALATFNFSQARVRARDVQRKNELKAIQNALEMYKNDKIPQEYPDSLDLLVTTYMSKLPVDPKEKVTAGSWEDYCYDPDTSDALKYYLVACLENAGDVDKSTASTNCSCAGTTGVEYKLTQP